MRIEEWYKKVLLAWLAFGLPIILLAIGFAGGDPLTDIDFSFYTRLDFVLWASGWAVVLAPVWLAPFGIRLQQRKDSKDGKSPFQ